MLKGNMELPIMEKGKPKIVKIHEGEVFLLPPMIPHSPQRSADSLGLVVETERKCHQLDCLRFYVDGTDNQEILWEEWFYCKNLEALPAILNRFKKSEEFATGKPSGLVRPSLSVDTTTAVNIPFSLKEFLDENLGSLGSGALTVVKSDHTEWFAYGPGISSFPASQHETLFWQYSGKATISLATEQVQMSERSLFLLKPGHSFEYKRDGIGFTICQFMER
eukprot:TRINITY_DN198_c0_g1_i8.p1 TRINITY_DN198_c0_g1~~TRINITY_DN198_c0_g1_i8.p1  ORF type:complete len:221 (+),score=42.38 TRINITY_DN198_c0_g1_i8:317-979(+)